MFVCAAVISETSQPLYLETFQPEQAAPGDVLTFHYLVHCALDGVEEKLTPSKKAPQQAGDSFLGLLYSTEDYYVYGYLTNTCIKLITATSNEAAKEEDVHSVRSLVLQHAHNEADAASCTWICRLLHTELTFLGRLRALDVQVLHSMHAAYVDAVSNPFHDAGQPLTSACFHQRVKGIVDAANAVGQST